MSVMPAQFSDCTMQMDEGLTNLHQSEDYSVGD